jgi:hypothetical protein
MKSIVLQKFANREIRIGWQDLPSVRPKAVDPSDVVRLTKEAELAALCAVQELPRPRGVYAYDPGKPSVTKLSHDEAKLLRTRQQASLDITSEFRRQRSAKRNYKKIPGTPNRRTVFGRNARHTLLEAGSVAERWGGDVQNSAIVTLTLPGSTKNAYSTLASWSGYACDRIFRLFRKTPGEVRWFYVWELQRRGALHMHLCITTQSPERSLQLGEVVVEQWKKVLDDIRHKSGVDLFLHKAGDRCTIKAYWQNDVQQCQRSVAAYFAKYASKKTQSAKKGFNGKAVEHPYYPSRWWGCQRLLRQDIEAERFSLRIEGLEEDTVANALILADNWCNGHCPIKTYRYDFDLRYVVNGETRTLGYGERSIAYFDDGDFTHVCNDLYQLARYLVHLCNGAYVQCNRMSALQTPVAMWSMQA